MASQKDIKEMMWQINFHKMFKKSFKKVLIKEKVVPAEDDSRFKVYWYIHCS